MEPACCECSRRDHADTLFPKRFSLRDKFRNYARQREENE